MVNNFNIYLENCVSWFHRILSIKAQTRAIGIDQYIHCGKYKINLAFVICPSNL